MPAAHPRAALAAVAGPSPASSCMAGMAGLASRFGSLQIAGGGGGSSARTFSSSHSLSSSLRPPQSSLPHSHSRNRSLRPPSSCLTSSSSTRRPVVASALTSTSSPARSAGFSTTSSLMKSRNYRRTKMRIFFRKEGQVLKRFDPLKPMYKSPFAAKFPYNSEFKSEAVLSDQARQLVWTRVVQRGDPVKAVAADTNIDVRRVAACVRLKELERAWILQGKPLAKAYAQAIQGMLPTLTLGEEDAGRTFEPTNEIASHPYTQQQLFLPVSESRHFTREDAARAFHPTLLSADKRMPIPQLVNAERNARHWGFPRAAATFRAEVDKEQVDLAQRQQQAVAAEEARTAKVDTGRFQFRIRDYNAEQVGKTGRARRAVGWRYGAPFNDRKRGLLKIPSHIG